MVVELDSSAVFLLANLEEKAMNFPQEKFITGQSNMATTEAVTWKALLVSTQNDTWNTYSVESLEHFQWDPKGMLALWNLQQIFPDTEQCQGSNLQWIEKGTPPPTTTTTKAGMQIHHQEKTKTKNPQKTPEWSHFRVMSLHWVPLNKSLI